MNKDQYQERSRKLKMPSRCPLVGYCGRWMYSVYYFNYYEDGDVGLSDVSVFLKRHGELPADFDSKYVPCSVDPPEIAKGKDTFQFKNCCPEINLYHSSYAPHFEKATALSSLSWTVEGGVFSKEYRHFSECLEFVQHARIESKISARGSVSAKLRFQIFQRDNFRCNYCGMSQSDGVKLHVDHKVSKHDGGSDEPENLVTSCRDCNLGKGKTSL